MVEFAFYRDVYGGDSVQEGEFRAYARDASAHLERYKRVYRVTDTAENSEQMALCAMIDAPVLFRLGAKRRCGSQRERWQREQQPGAGRAAGSNPAAQNRELYRCAQLYLDIYRGTERGW